MTRKGKKAPAGTAVAGGLKLRLSPEDRNHLKQFEMKLQVVRDRTVQVAKRYITGFFLHGPGGIGKSYTVEEELKRLKIPYVLSNSRMSGRGLYDTLKRSPGAIHVLEDMERLVRDPDALGVLRSATWGQRRHGGKGRRERKVTWTIHGRDDEIIFTGGIIANSNRPLLDVPELNAFRTRVPVMHLQASAAELIAMMKKLSLRGYRHEDKVLTPQECWEVCEFIIEESQSLHRPLDLRVMDNSFMDYLAWRDGVVGCDWRDLVASRLQERTPDFREPVAIRGRRAARKQTELDIAREILASTEDGQERLRLWKERAGKSQSAFYRRRDELKRA
jgi:hypothetical protein